MNTLRITVLNEDSEEVELELPARFAVCPRCHGRGTHDHPAFARGITSDEWRGPDWDDESRAAYMNGAYDVTCSECKGERVVVVVDEERFTAEQRAIWTEHLEQCRVMEAESASERYLRMAESGGY